MVFVGWPSSQPCRRDTLAIFADIERTRRVSCSIGEIGVVSRRDRDFPFPTAEPASRDQTPSPARAASARSVHCVSRTCRGLLAVPPPEAFAVDGHVHYACFRPCQPRSTRSDHKTVMHAPTAPLPPTPPPPPAPGYNQGRADLPRLSCQDAACTNAPLWRALSSGVGAARFLLLLLLLPHTVSALQQQRRRPGAAAQHERHWPCACAWGSAGATQQR